MESLQPQSSPNKRSSPWRRAFRKLTPPRKNPSPVRDDLDVHADANPNAHVAKKKTKRLFSSPVKKFKRRSKRKALLRNQSKPLHDEEQVVTVQVLPKSPMRDPSDKRGGNQEGSEEIQIHIKPISPPRILKTHVRTLDTENTFHEMFQSYLDKYHNHGDFNHKFLARCKLTNQLKMSRYPSSVDSTSDTSCSIEDVRVIRLTTKDVSDVTLPRPIRDPMSPLEVLSRLSLCVSEVADAITCSCVSMSPPRSHARSYRPPTLEEHMTDTDTECHEGNDSDEDDGNSTDNYDDEASTSTYDGESSSLDLTERLNGKSD